MTPTRTERPSHRPRPAAHATRIVALRHAQPRRRATRPPQPVAADPRRSSWSCHRLTDAIAAAIVGHVRERRAVDVLSVGLPDPSELETADVRPADRRLRPDRQGRARSLPARGTPGRRVRRRPAARPRRDDHRRGPDLLGEQRVRRAGHHGGRRRGRQRRPRARRLDHHPAARPGPAAARPRSPRPAPTATCARPRRSSSRCGCPTTFPGETGKERVITAYLNEIFYGHGAYGIAAAALDLLRRLRPRRADAGPGGAAGRPAQVALDARSVPLRGQGRQGPAGRPAELAAGRPPRLDPAGPRRGRPLDDADAEPSSRPRSPSRSSSPATSRGR